MVLEHYNGKDLANEKFNYLVVLWEFSTPGFSNPEFSILQIYFSTNTFWKKFGKSKSSIAYI